MTRRFWARLAVLVATAATPLALVVGSASAAANPLNEHDPSLGVGLTIVEFVIVPLAIFGVVAFLALLPSMLRKPRYRPGKSWDHDPLWFGGPDDPETALQSARPGSTAKGGASAEW